MREDSQEEIAGGNRRRKIAEGKRKKNRGREALEKIARRKCGRKMREKNAGEKCGRKFLEGSLGGIARRIAGSTPREKIARRNRLRKYGREAWEEIASGRSAGEKRYKDVLEKNAGETAGGNRGRK